MKKRKRAPSTGSSLSHSHSDKSSENRNISPNCFIFERLFKSKAEKNQFIESERCWSYRSGNKTANGYQTMFRCNHVTKAGPQCAAKIYTLEHFDDNKDHFKVFHLNRNHTHDTLPNKAWKVQVDIKQMVIEYHINGNKPKTIAYALRKKDIPDVNQPTINQIYAIINAYKKAQFGRNPLTLGELQKFVEIHMAIPNEDDTSFIVAFDRSPSNDPQTYFRFFVSTPRLLRMAAKAKNIHADATHKLTIERVPLLIVGSTDMSRKFHLIGITLASNETTQDYTFTFNAVKVGVQKITGFEIEPFALVSDADPAIHKGFKNAFNIDKKVMCYAHVMSNVHRKYKFNFAHNKKAIKKDLRVLHDCSNETMFDIGCALFVAKWTNAEKQATRILKKSFFQKYKYWFKGCAHRIPKTNNALERFNGSLKQLQTYYRKVPLKQFKAKILDIVKERSQEYRMDKPDFNAKVVFSEELIESGCKLRMKYASKKSEKEVTFYTFASDINKQITLEDVDRYREQTYATFDDFKKNAFDLIEITFPKRATNWKELAVCSCDAFDEKYICDHIIAIAFTVGLIEPVVNKNNDIVPLLPSKSGRPKKATPALQKD